MWSTNVPSRALPPWQQSLFCPATWTERLLILAEKFTQYIFYTLPQWSIWRFDKCLYNMWGCVFSVYPFPLWWFREYMYILCLIIIIKSEVWTNNHCLGLGHETSINMYTLLSNYSRIMYKIWSWHVFDSPSIYWYIYISESNWSLDSTSGPSLFKYIASSASLFGRLSRYYIPCVILPSVCHPMTNGMWKLFCLD